MSEEDISQNSMGNEEGIVQEPSSEKSVLEYTTEVGESLQLTLGNLAVFMDRALATSKIDRYEKLRISFKISLAMDYIRAGMINEAKYELAQIGAMLQLGKSENGFYLTNMKTTRQEISQSSRPMPLEQNRGFLSRLWRGGRKQ